MELESSLQLIRFLTYSYLNFGISVFFIYQLNIPLPPALKGRLKTSFNTAYMLYCEGKHTCLVNMAAYNSYHRTVDTFAASKQIANTVMNRVAPSHRELCYTLLRSEPRSTGPNFISVAYLP